MATARKTSSQLTISNAPVYELRIELVDVQPEVCCTVLIPGSATLTKVHATILWGMGWEGRHLHESTIGYEAYGMPDPEFDEGRKIKPEGQYTLAGAVGKLKSFRYEHDFGDSWEHVIKIEKILPPDHNLTAHVRAPVGRWVMPIS